METMSNLGTGARSELTAYQLQAYTYIPYSYTKTTATDHVPQASTSVSCPLPISPAQGTSCVDVIVNQSSSLTGMGLDILDEHIGHASFINQHELEPKSQIITLHFSTGLQPITLA